MILSDTLSEQFETLYNMGVSPGLLDSAKSFLIECPDYGGTPFVGTDTEYEDVDIIWENIGIYCTMSSKSTVVHFAYHGMTSDVWRNYDTDANLVCIFIMSCIDIAIDKLNPYTQI